MRRYYYSSQCWPIYVIHVPYVSVIVVPSDSLSLRYLYVTATSSLYLNWFYICSQVLIPCLCCYLIYLNWFYICSQAAYCIVSIPGLIGYDCLILIAEILLPSFLRFFCVLVC